MTNKNGSYTYPDHPTDKDRQGVLRNKLGLTRHSQLRPVEYRATERRIDELNAGQGPRGSLDAAHLKAMHKHIFQDVYEWAGSTRAQTPIVDGARVDAIGNFSKMGTAFLHGSKIDLGLHEALKPLADRHALMGMTPNQFAEKAGTVLGELNYVHPFREGNGRTQEAFIKEVGRQAGYEIDMSGITKERMIAASIEHANDPKSGAMIDLIKDSIEHDRRHALKDATKAIADLGKDPHDFNVRTAQPGQQITGPIFFATKDAVTVADQSSLVVFDRADLPAELPLKGQSVEVTARGEFGAQRDSAAQSNPRAEAPRHETPRDEQPRGRDSSDYER